MPPLGNLRTVTNIGDEWVEGEEHRNDQYWLGEAKGARKGSSKGGFNHTLGPQPEPPSLEELHAPAPKKTKARKPRAKKDPAVDKAADKDLKTRGIK